MGIGLAEGRSGKEDTARLAFIVGVGGRSFCFDDALAVFGDLFVERKGGYLFVEIE